MDSREILFESYGDSGLREKWIEILAVVVNFKSPPPMDCPGPALSLREVVG